VIRAESSNDGSLEGNGGQSRVASPIVYKGQRRLALRHRDGAKRRAGAPYSGSSGSSDPMIEADAPSTEEVTASTFGSGVPAPPGVVMVAPPEATRNAEGRKVNKGQSPVPVE
jgi:hypothetical protein